MSRPRFVSNVPLGPVGTLCLALAALLSPSVLSARAETTTDAPRRLGRLTPPAKAKSGGGGTRCEACHTTAGFRFGRFPHERTGFPLEGAHGRVECRGCHRQAFDAPLPRHCAGCHVDPHAGELGASCAGCHDERSWESRFVADAHRRSSFPLVGRHGALPCEACHQERRPARFSSLSSGCVTCHQADFDRTAGTPVDHARLSLGTECARCHEPWGFLPARFPQHDACFEVTGGPHAGIPCAGCHGAIPQVSGVGLCASRSTTCTSCHVHACDRSDPLHAAVPGYQCKDAKCYECHQLKVLR